MKFDFGWMNNIRYQHQHGPRSSWAGLSVKNASNEAPDTIVDAGNCETDDIPVLVVEQIEADGVTSNTLEPTVTVY